MGAHWIACFSFNLVCSCYLLFVVDSQMFVKVKIWSTSLSHAKVVVGVLIKNHMELGIHCLMTMVIFACVGVVILVASFNLSSLFLDSSFSFVGIHLFCWFLEIACSCGPLCAALDDHTSFLNHLTQQDWLISLKSLVILCLHTLVGCKNNHIIINILEENYNSTLLVDKWLTQSIVKVQGSLVD